MPQAWASRAHSARSAGVRRSAATWRGAPLLVLRFAFVAFIVPPGESEKAEAIGVLPPGCILDMLFFCSFRGASVQSGVIAPPCECHSKREAPRGVPQAFLTSEGGLRSRPCRAGKLSMGDLLIYTSSFPLHVTPYPWRLLVRESLRLGGFCKNAVIRAIICTTVLNTSLAALGSCLARRQKRRLPYNPGRAPKSATLDAPPVPKPRKIPQACTGTCNRCAPGA